MPQQTPSKTRWHQLLGKLLEEWLTPVGITVQTDVPVTSEPTKADILLLRNSANRWNAAQKSRLPDGIRESHASYILIEFKYSESVNKDAFLQTLSYDTLYRRTQHLRPTRLQSFIVSSRTCQQETLDTFGYVQSDHEGVYHSDNPLLREVGLILLNELSEAAHNAPIKCFASQKAEQHKAFRSIDQHLKKLPVGMERFIYGLQKLLFTSKGGETMQLDQGVTPEYVMKVGKEAIEQILSSLPPEDRIAGLRTEDVLKNFKTDEIQRYLDSLKK